MWPAVRTLLLHTHTHSHATHTIHRCTHTLSQTLSHGGSCVNVVIRELLTKGWISALSPLTPLLALFDEEISKLYLYERNQTDDVSLSSQLLASASAMLTRTKGPYVRSRRCDLAHGGCSFLAGVVGRVSVDCWDFLQRFTIYFIAAEPSSREFKAPQAA